MYNKLKFLIVLNLFFLPVKAQQVTALQNEIVVEKPASSLDFPIVSISGQASSINYDENDFKGVVRAIIDLQTDIESVTTVKPTLLTSKVSSKQIIVGTLGKSSLINKLVSSGELDADPIKDKWESFVIHATENKLIIAGSDKRGTIYGVYELSRQLGVSPWYWWADVPVKQRVSAYVKAGEYFSEEPKVKYRGIFINDEEPAFGSWAREKFGGINSDMYIHMFELLLRLRANYLWPAMWGKAFNEDDPLNPKLADEYGIVMGTSHHEPMMRAQKEWGNHREEYGNGQWNYQTNEEGLKKFWRDGMQRNKNYENIVTMSMRGDGDLPMADAGSAKENFKVLEKIMKDQREIIREVTGKPAKETPQIWALYSEVLEFYDQGMNVPDDMTLLLVDDNWGNVRRLPNLNQKPHPGGYGMYYHVDLHGAPRAYQWLNMTQIQHMWEQLQLTYDYGVDKIWILNVGDLKPNEFPMDFFLNMAWNPDSFTADNLFNYTQKFCAEQFGEEAAYQAAIILDTYTKYNSRVTAEMLDEETYNLENGEFKRVRDEYMALETLALRQYHETISEQRKSAYKQLILHPVRAMANLYDMYYSVAMNYKLAEENDLKANYWADRVEKTFKRDSLLSVDYNLTISDGKWNHMMDQTHIGYTTWDEPKEGNIMPEIKWVDSVDSRHGGYTFSQQNKVIIIEAEHFYQKESSTKTQWTIIPNLGRTLSGIALMPYTESPEDAQLEYRIKFRTTQDSIKVKLIFDSVLPYRKNGHSVSVSFKDQKPTTINLNKDLTWANNYSKMYPAAAARIIEKDMVLPVDNTKHEHILIFKPLDAGVVLHKIIIDMGGYQESYLKMKESPYSKNDKIN